MSLYFLVNNKTICHVKKEKEKKNRKNRVLLSPLCANLQNIHEHLFPIILKSKKLEKNFTFTFFSKNERIFRQKCDIYFRFISLK